MENHPNVLAELARCRPLAGNDCGVLARVRDPMALAAVLRHAGLPVPECTLDASGLPRDGSYLRKPVRSASGAGITVWDKRCRAPQGSVGWYFQRRIEGLACAAAYVAAKGRACLVGLTQQRMATGREGGCFRYAGSVGPLDLSPELRQRLMRLGDVLAEACGLVGWFGADGILANGEFWTVEVNPRYTASAEVLERGLGIGAVALHMDACLHAALPRDLPQPRGQLHGKAILVAPCRLEVRPEFTAWALEAATRDWPALADIPQPHTEIPAGQPVLTVFASGESVRQVHERLDMELSRQRHRLFGA
jgi:predicted ATP-grasp superfamily ATP-dependent carboligase